MPEDNRSSIIGGLWFFSTLALATLFISAGAQGELTLGHIALACVILGLAVTGTVFFSRNPEISAQRSKAKRQELDDMLRDMSAEERMELKQRVLDGNFHEEPIVDYIGDDGELITRN